MHLPATHPSGLWRRCGRNKRTEPQSGENAQAPLFVHHAAQSGLVYPFWRRQSAGAMPACCQQGHPCCAAAVPVAVCACPVPLCSPARLQRKHYWIICQLSRRYHQGLLCSKWEDRLRWCGRRDRWFPAAVWERLARTGAWICICETQPNQAGHQKQPKPAHGGSQAQDQLDWTAHPIILTALKTKECDAGAM